VLIELTGDIESTTLNKSATITIEGKSYTGKVVMIVEHAITVPETGKVTTEGVGLKVVS
jgi:hypothetical protein